VTGTVFYASKRFDKKERRTEARTDNKTDRQTESKTDRQGRQMSGWMDG